MTIFFFIPIIFLLLLSVIGYGFVFNKLFLKQQKLEFGLYGILGIILLTFYSYISNLFIAHGAIHNLVIHLFGLLLFFNFFKKRKQELFYLLIISVLILIPALLISKTHDDFPYYHLPYIVNIIENKILIGNGNFGLAHRTHSSIFYFSSLFFLPFLEFKLINLSYFSTLLFFNILILEKILKKENIQNSNLNFYLYLLFFIFINIIFYRIAEYGTDRTGQIFVFLIFIYFFNIIYELEDYEFNFKLLSTFIIFLITLKSYFLSYFIILFVTLFFLFKKDKLRFDIFFNQLNFFLILVFSIYILKNFLNNGCLIYPIYFTCFDNFLWSQSFEDVKYLNSWYELWSKGGAGPNFRVEDPHIYVKNFNWVLNWIDIYFFNKISDFLLGIITISLICFFSFYSNLKSKKKRKTILPMMLISLIALIWFLKHPSLRYGGFSIIALIIFFPLSLALESFKISLGRKKSTVIGLVLLSLLIFEARNISRIKKEILVYNFDLVNAPLSFIKEIQSKNISKNDIEIFNPINNSMCWATKSPCVYRKELKVKKKFSYKIFYK